MNSNQMFDKSISVMKQHRLYHPAVNGLFIQRTKPLEEIEENSLPLAIAQG